jgi:opacity protein-like surface antigen
LDKNVNLDLAYQYSAQNGDFYPFMNYYENGVSGAPDPEDNECHAVNVSNKRHQLLLTIGYRF